MGKESLEIYQRGENYFEIGKKNAYFVMDDHRFLMPNRKEHDVGILAIMKDFTTYTHLWEPFTTDLIKKEIKIGQKVIDIGASIGYFTNLLARCVGKEGKVLAFEPTPNQFPYLLKNIKANGYDKIVKAFNIAAWDKEEKIGMPPIDKKFICKGRKVDDILNEEKIGKVDFIKIDVDGSEPQVLKGLLKTFQNNNLKMVFEWYPSYIEKCGGNPDEVKSIIDKYFYPILFAIQFLFVMLL